MENEAAHRVSHDVYRHRNPSESAHYRCVQDHFEQLEAVWSQRYEQRYGFWRPYVLDVIYRYLDCGDLHCGFARVRCDQCGHEYLLAFSCKRRHFCPSCHQKRVVAFSERLVGQVLKKVPHRQWVFAIPKRLRIYFLFDRKLLAKLSRCAGKVLRAYLQQGAAGDDATPGAVVAVHTFGEFQRFNPHLHVIATDGCFSGTGSFTVAPAAKTVDVQKLFRYEVFKMLKAEGKITDAVIENMMGWRHSGFNVYCGPTIWPDAPEAIEDLARYIVRACFSQERMAYIPAAGTADGQAKVIYSSKDRRESQTFNALDWLAQLVTHIPNKGEQMVRYYGYYSNKARGMRQKAQCDDDCPALIESPLSSSAWRKNWARLIQKIYEVDPLLCPKCHGAMRIIAFIEEQPVIKRILSHLGLWQIHNHDPPKARADPVPAFESEFTIDTTYSQLPLTDYWD